MASETCGICESQVLYSDAVHTTIHTRDEEGVVDFYVCRSCYEEELAPLFEPADPDEEPDAEEPDAEEPDAEEPDPEESEPEEPEHEEPV